MGGSSVTSVLRSVIGRHLPFNMKAFVSNFLTFLCNWLAATLRLKSYRSKGNAIMFKNIGNDI